MKRCIDIATTLVLISTMSLSALEVDPVIDITPDEPQVATPEDYQEPSATPSNTVTKRYHVFL